MRKPSFEWWKGPLWAALLLLALYSWGKGIDHLFDHEWLKSFWSFLSAAASVYLSIKAADRYDRLYRKPRPTSPNIVVNVSAKSDVDALAASLKAALENHEKKHPNA